MSEPHSTVIHRLEAARCGGLIDMRRIRTACDVQLRNTSRGWMQGERVYRVAHSGEVAAFYAGELSSETGNYCQGCFPSRADMTRAFA